MEIKVGTGVNNAAVDFPHPTQYVQVRIHTEKHTGKHKGYAHVHVDEASMDAAIKYNQTEFHGRRIKVMYAQPKKDDQTRTQND